MLLTDAWARGNFWKGFGTLGRTISARWHPGMEAAKIRAPTGQTILRELAFGFNATPPWSKIQKRNQWFQQWVVGNLRRMYRDGQLRGVTHCFAYSYAAKEIFEWCHEVGIRCVLGQVDPGPSERTIISDLRSRHPEWAEKGEPSEAYWEDWRRELSLADVVVVNSQWSRDRIQALTDSPKRLVVIPLAYERAELPQAPALSEDNPRSMRVLFLGQVCLRKGIHDLIEAARLLSNYAITFEIVGEHGSLPPNLPLNVHFRGKAGRHEVARYYRNADVFVLPTHSDGFALTQLEAMSHGLPVVTTVNCARLVQDEGNGLLFAAGDSSALSAALLRLHQEPDLRLRLGKEAKRTARYYSVGQLARQLQQVEDSARSTKSDNAC